MISNRRGCLISILCFAFAHGHAETKLYCIYTPEFEKMYEDYFLLNIQDSFEIIAKKCPQECPTSIYKSEGWEKTMLRKLQLIEEAIEENWNNQIFVYSDIDIIFLQPIMETLLSWLGARDFVIQQGWPKQKLCAGFFVMRGNEKTRQLILQARYLLENNLVSDDQIAMQKALDTFPSSIDWAFLPSEQFPNGRRVLINDSLYTLGSEIRLHPSIKLFHANCTIGLQNKYLFLTQVLTQYSKRNN